MNFHGIYEILYNILVLNVPFGNLWIKLERQVLELNILHTGSSLQPCFLQRRERKVMNWQSIADVFFLEEEEWGVIWVVENAQPPVRFATTRITHKNCLLYRLTERLQQVFKWEHYPLSFLHLIQLTIGFGFPSSLAWADRSSEIPANPLSMYCKLNPFH